MAHNFELIENKLCTNKSNTELMRKIFGRYSDIISIWEDIGFDQNTINNRIELLQQAILNTITEINEGEIDLYNQIKDSIDRYKKRVDDLKLRLKVDIDSVISQLAIQNKIQPNEKDKDNSFEIDQSLIISNQTKLLEENYFYKNLAIELERIKDERKKRYVELKNREESLAEKLDETLNSPSNKSVLNESDLRTVEEHVNNLNLEKKNRLQLIRKFHDNIVKINKENQIELDLKSSLNQFKYFDDDCIQDLNIDSSSMNSYRKSMDKLINKRDELIENINAIRQDIIYMWGKFEIRNESLASQLETSTELEYTQQKFNLLLAEYDRCVEQKKARLQNFIADLRNQIKAIFQKISFSSDDIFKLEFLNETQMSEELLTIHENYLQELKVYSIKYQSMFELIQEWTKKWDEHVRFETEYSDPARFSKRNYSSLFEERERKKIGSELNRLERQLEVEDQHYFEKEKKHFKYINTTVLEFIRAQKEKFELERENIRKQRQTSKKTSDQRKYVKQNSKVSTPNNNLIRNKNIKTQNSAIKNSPLCISKTSSVSRTDGSAANGLKTPRILTANSTNLSNNIRTIQVARSMKPNSEINKSKKRISFTDLHKIKRENLSKSPSRRLSRSDHQKIKSIDCNDETNGKESLNFDSILGGNYKYKGKNGNISSGIESIVSMSDFDFPACNSSFKFEI